jgi:hypothetical protein
MQQNIAPVKVSGNSEEVIVDLFDAFLENYSAFKAGKMSQEAEENYKILGSPAPSQYRAFVDFFGFFENEENMVWEKRDYIYMYDLADMDVSGKPAMLGFVQNLDSPDFDAQGKNIVLAFGSFWGQHYPTRKEIISHLTHLHEKGADIRIFTQAATTEEHIVDIISPIKEKSRFGIKKRIPIHFIRAGNDFVFFEFPHTETTVLRLNMFLDVNAIKLKPKRTKDELLHFFDNLITGALEE